MASRFVMTIRDDDPVAPSASESDEEERLMAEKPQKKKAKTADAAENGKKSKKDKTEVKAAAPASAAAPSAKDKAGGPDINADFDFEMEVPKEMAWDPSYQYVTPQGEVSTTEDKISRVLNKRKKEEVGKLLKEDKTKKTAAKSGSSDEGSGSSSEDEDESEGSSDESGSSSESGSDSEGSGSEDEDDKKSKKKTKDGKKDGKDKKPTKKVTLADLEADEEPALFRDEEEEGEEDEEDTAAANKEKKKSSFFAEAPKAESNVSTFAQLNLSRALLKGVTALGYTAPTPVQVRCIPIALAGRDICACASTGSGKTAAFMLPILERLLFRPKNVAQTRVVVLSPTRELAVQVCQNAQAMAKFTDMTFCLAVGGMSVKVQETELRNRPDVIIATPGRLVDHIHNTVGFDLSTVEVLILDEADRLLEVGFADEVDLIVRHCPVGRQTMLFSATMTDEVEDLIKLSLREPVRLFIDKNKQVTSNLVQEFIRIRPNHEDDRDAITLSLCKRVYTTKTVIFVRAKKHAHRLRIVFGLAGLRAAELHGSLTQQQRLEALDNFKGGLSDFLICTDLAGRGIDIPDVETVINWSMPNTIKQYIHRVGRTARAGKSGRSVTMVGDQERRLLRELHKSSKDQMKNRIVKVAVIDKFKAFIDGLEGEIKEILKAEREEAAILQAEQEVRRAQNLIEHEQEIYSRAPRTWIMTEKEKKERKDLSKQAHEGKSVSLPSTKKLFAFDKKEEEAKAGKGVNAMLKKLAPEDAKSMKMQLAMARAIKRDKKPKKIRMFNEDNNGNPVNKKAKSGGGKTSGFTRELTDTSKKAVKQLRSNADAAPAKVPKSKMSKGEKNKAKVPKQKSKFAPKGKQFKSKTRFKRR